jgi:hypothetical protein
MARSARHKRQQIRNSKRCIMPIPEKSSPFDGGKKNHTETLSGFTKYGTTESKGDQSCDFVKK